MPDLIIRELIVERNGRVVLDGCNAEFASGQRTVLWGPSGAGKSTLLNAIDVLAENQKESGPSRFAVMNAVTAVARHAGS